MSDFDKEMFERIIKTQDIIAKDISDMKVTQGVQQEILKEHVRRSDLNEKAIDVLKNELRPIQKHVDGLNGILRFFGFVGILATIVGTILRLFRIL